MKCRFQSHPHVADLQVLPGGRPCGSPRENGIPRVSVGDFGQLPMWLTCLYRASVFYVSCFLCQVHNITEHGAPQPHTTEHNSDGLSLIALTTGHGDRTAILDFKSLNIKVLYYYSYFLPCGRLGENSPQPATELLEPKYTCNTLIINIYTSTSNTLMMCSVVHLSTAVLSCSTFLILLVVCLLRFGELFVAGPPRWGGTCHSFQPFSCLVHRPWGCACYVLGCFSCLVHRRWGCACYVLGVFRSRSTAVGRDLARFGALFVPGPPPVEEGGRKRWSSNRQFLLTFETAAIPFVSFFFFEKGPIRDCCLFIMMSVATVALQILVLPSGGGAPCSLW